MAKLAMFVAVVLVVMSSPASGQTPLGSAFTYQGVLKDAGQPFNGSVNLVFRLFNAQVGGTLLGTQTINSVAVASGVFNVQLNEAGQFGASPFNGDRRWLEVAVNGNTLSPRQELTATPYATYATRPWVKNGTALSYVDGNVGIGTSSPTSPLHVVASGYGLEHSLGAARLSTFVDPNNVWIGSVSPHPFHIFTANGPARLTVDTTGNVGIGSTTPAFPLTIGTPFLSYGWVHSDGVRQVGSYIDATGGWLGTRSNHPLHLFTNNGTPQVTLTPAGNLGIGTTEPAWPLTITSSSSPFVEAYGWVHTDGTRQLGSYINSFGGWLGTRSNDPLFFFTNNASAQVTLTTAGNLGIGTTNPQQRLHVNGTTRTNVLQVTGADLAERFPVSDEPQPGMVMEIDPDQPGRLRVAREAYTPRVAGVVSGAGDLAAGAVLGHLPGYEDAPPIALSGRVWVLCDASAAPIAPGDLLTTADRAGHAMKALDRERAQGTVLGKAMTKLDLGNTGLVLVLVTLQ
jgi:hypothetical protein